MEVELYYNARDDKWAKKMHLNTNVSTSKKHKYKELKLCCWFRKFKKKVKLGKMKEYH